jgi:hypothetical protein
MASRRKRTTDEIDAYLALLQSVREEDGLQLRLPFKAKQNKVVRDHEQRRKG